MNNLPTAEEFLIEDNTSDDTLAIADVMIRFAKLHVKAALKAAAEQAEWSSTANDIGFGGSAGYDFIDTDYAGDPSTGYKVFVNKDSILNAYPLNLIQ